MRFAIIQSLADLKLENNKTEFAFKQATALLLRLFYSDILYSNFIVEKPSFASEVKNSKESKVERPNCLNFKHRNVSKRNKAIEFIKNLQFSKSKLLGVAEMPGKSIDITCKSRDDVLKLYKKIQAVSDIIKVKLYESDNIHVVAR